MTSKLQEGRTVKVPAEENKSWLPSIFQGGRKALSDRKKRLDEEETKANSYAKGGAVARDRDDKRYTGTVSDKSGDYESYRDSKNKERLIAPATGKEKGSAGAGRGHVNETSYAKGGMVRRGYGKARGGC